MNIFSCHVFMVGCMFVNSMFISSCNQKDTSKIEIKSSIHTIDANLTILGPEFIPIRTCEKLMSDLSTDDNTAVLAPTSAEFQLVIRKVNPLELSDRVFRKTSSDTSWKLAKETGKAKPTRWDFDLELEQPTTTSSTTEYKNAKIKINLIPSTHKFRFVEDKYVIRAGNESGYTTFCGVIVDKNVASFTAIYNPKSKPENPSFNIGLIVEDKHGDYEMPIYLDPEVRNEG